MTELVTDPVSSLKDELEKLAQIASQFQSQATNSETIYQSQQDIKKMLYEKKPNENLMNYQKKCLESINNLTGNLLKVSTLMEEIWDSQAASVNKQANQIEALGQKLNFIDKNLGVQQLGFPVDKSIEYKRVPPPTIYEKKADFRIDLDATSGIGIQPKTGISGVKPKLNTLGEYTRVGSEDKLSSPQPAEIAKEMKAFATSIRASAALGMAQAAKRISGMAARLDRSSAVPEAKSAKVSSIPPPPSGKNSVPPPPRAPAGKSIPPPPPSSGAAPPPPYCFSLTLDRKHCTDCRPPAGNAPPPYFQSNIRPPYFHFISNLRPSMGGGPPPYQSVNSRPPPPGMAAPPPPSASAPKAAPKAAMSFQDQLKNRIQARAEKDEQAAKPAPKAAVPAGMSFQDQLKFRLAQKQKAEDEGQETTAPPSPVKQKEDEGTSFQDQLKNRLNKRQTMRGTEEETAPPPKPTKKVSLPMPPMPVHTGYLHSNPRSGPPPPPPPPGIGGPPPPPPMTSPASSGPPKISTKKPEMTLQDQLKQKALEKSMKPAVDVESLVKSPDAATPSTPSAPAESSFQDQLKAKLKKRETTGGDAAQPAFAFEKKPVPAPSENNFQDQLKNRLKKRQETQGAGY
ncbi:hypothetical protein HDV01_000510 [Terramyces sp. JEL0728]|nr:hypothetical protein HDV01_000510 [Terramyces sp. JEL0728]